MAPNAFAAVRAQAALRGIEVHAITESDGCVAGYYMHRRGVGRAYSDLDDVREVLRRLGDAAQQRSHHITGECTA